MMRLHVHDLVEGWRRANRVPGGVVAIVEGEHELLLEGFGSSDIFGHDPVDPAATLFRAGDIARVLTATFALKTVESGKLDLDSDITSRTPLVDEELGPLTLRQLLVHTAGIDQRRIGTRAHREEDLLPLALYLERRMPARVRPPGVISVPADHGYALVGRMIEQVSDGDFPTLLERDLLIPIGMYSTSALSSTPPVHEIAKGHRWRAERWTTVGSDFSQTLPASSLVTTAADMALWMRTILAGGSLEGRRVLSEESVGLLLERQFSHHDSLPGRSLALREGRHLDPAELYQTAFGNGFSSALVLLPARRVGLFVAFNAEIDLWDLIFAILDPFERPRRRAATITDGAHLTLEVDPSGTWRDAAVSRASAEALVGLVRQDRIRRGPDGSVIWRGQTLEPAGSSCFEEPATGTRLCFGRAPGTRPFAAIGDLVLEKLAWYETRPVQIFLWVAFTAVFLAAGWPRRTFPTQHRALSPSDPYSPRWPLSLARLAAAIHFAFVAALSVLLATVFRTDSATLLYGVPAVVPLLLSLPLVAGLFTLTAMVGLPWVWRATHATTGHRLRVTLLIVALVLFLPFLWSWNLLGFRV